MAAPSQNDITSPFDPTGYTTIDGAQLLQLVSGLLPYLDKGFIVTTTDANGSPQVPDARSTGTPKWQTYIWRRIGFDGNIYVYVWNPNRAIDIIYLSWEPITLTGISSGTITAGMIANGAVSPDNISALSQALVYAVLGSATGDLTGIYPNLSLNSQTITGGGAGGKIVQNTITASELAINCVDPTTSVFKPSATALQILRTNAGKTAAEWVDPTSVISISTSIVAGSTWGAAQLTTLTPTFTPSQIRAALICNSADGAFAIGDEIDMQSVYYWNDTPLPVGTLWYNKLARTVNFRSYNSTVLYINDSSSGLGNTVLTYTKWKVKLYATA